MLSGAISLLLSALMAAGMLQLWKLIVAGALASLGSAFHGSAFDTSYAMLMHDHDLPRANGRGCSLRTRNDESTHEGSLAGNLAGANASEVQGRIFSVRTLIAQFMEPLAMAARGWAAAIFSPGLIVAAAGVILLVFCVGQLFNRQLLRVEDKAWLDGMAAAG